MSFHKNLSGTDIHVVHAYTYADSTARGAATGFTSADVGKVAWQQDTNVLYLLTDDSPITWVAIGSGGGGGAVDSVNGFTGVVVLDTDDISEGSTNKYFTDERAQDAVGAALTDTASIDLTYNDGANTISGAVLPAGVDHDALNNFVANEHIDHTTVTLTAGNGLSGGGDISANRTFEVDLNELTTVTATSSDYVSIVDVSDSNNSKKALISDITSMVSLGITELTGDVTAGPGSGSQAATIANQAVTFAKFQNISTAKLLGRYTSGSGSTEEVSLGNNLSYANSTLNAASYLKEHVDVATIAALTVTSSGSGIGQTLTNAGAQAALVIDGVTMTVNDRVLVKDQGNAENGIYSVTDIGSVSTNWVLTRATDADGSDAGQVAEGMQVTALRGSNARIIYILTTANPITVGSTTLTFEANNAGGISGSGTANRVAYFDSSGVLTTTSFLDVDSTDKTLRHYQSAATANAVINGIALTNDTAATSGNQQYSGAVYWKGSGWRTGGGGSSTVCEFRSYILPVQSSGSSECTLVFEANQAGAGWVNVLHLRNNSSAPQLLAEFASTALPSYSYRVDPDTGLRRSGTNAQALICGGAEIAGVDVNGFCVGTLGMNNANFGVHPTTTTKHGAVWRSRNSISVDYFNFQNDSATQEASLFRSSGTSGDWKWRMTGGTAALPAYSFYSQTTIGMYAAGTNILGFAVAGAEAFRVAQGSFKSSYDSSNHLEITVSSSGLVNLTATGSSGAFYFQNHIYMQDAKDFSFNGITGTKIGQGTSEKLAFWGTTPIIQPTTGVAAATLTGGGGTTLTDTDTFDGYTLKQVVKALRNIGLLA